MPHDMVEIKLLKLKETKTTWVSSPRRSAASAQRGDDMLDEPLDTSSNVPPGFTPLTPLQNLALCHAARLAVALARAQIRTRRPSQAGSLWRRLVATFRREPVAALEGDVSAIAVSALKPLCDVCVTLPPESAQLVGALAAQAILVECLRGDVTGVHQLRAASRSD